MLAEAPRLDQVVPDREPGENEAVTYRWISFTTDYGARDGFVASCHGVIARIAPDARVLDVTHLVPPQAVRTGAVLLARTVPYLPASVHLAVVDPGVGTARRGVVVETPRGHLVGPDNGLLMPAADALGGVVAAHELADARFRLPHVSATFHGRDIFAPAAAHISLGVPPAEFGPPAGELVRLPEPKLTVRPGELTAEVLTIDSFGNVQLAATSENLAEAGISGTATVRTGHSATDRRPDRDEHNRHSGHPPLSATVGRTFADVPAGETVLYPDSAGLLAVAVNLGSAAGALGLGDYISDSPQELTVTSSPTESFPGRTTANLTPNATPPFDARR